MPTASLKERLIVIKMGRSAKISCSTMKAMSRICGTVDSISIEKRFLPILLAIRFVFSKVSPSRQD